MKVLVTGANGFIGSHLVKALIKKRYSVRSMVRATSLRESLKDLDTEIVIGNILDIQSLKAAIEGCDLLFHVAGVFSYWGYQPEQLIHEAKQGVTNVLSVLKDSSVKKTVLTSSSVTFGSTEKKTIITERSKEKIDESLTYVLAKKTQVDVAFQLAEQYNVPLISVHPTITIGENDYGLTESNKMIIRYLKDKYKTTWIGGCNLVGIDDVVNGHILAMENGCVGEQYILGSENMEWQTIHSLISKYCGLPGPYLTAYHTSAYLASWMQEMMSVITGKEPASSRQQAKMVGKYYWYDHSKIAKLGYVPEDGKSALIKTLSWLIRSKHVPASLRAEMNISHQLNTKKTLK